MHIQISSQTISWTNKYLNQVQEGVKNILFFCPLINMKRLKITVFMDIQVPDGYTVLIL